MNDVAVIGGGVVGTAVALALARRGVDTVLLEARDELAGAASGTNSGILHTGFDSTMDELETRLILRSAELRDAVIDTLGIPVRRCGALVRGIEETNGVPASGTTTARWRSRRGDHRPGPLHVRAGRRGRRPRRRDPHRRARGRAATTSPPLTVNCAGLYADEVARLFGDDSFEIYPRKGEFFVFDGIPLERILLPAPTRRTKGVLVFPTLDGKVVAGPRRSTRPTRRTGRSGRRRSTRCARRRPSCCPRSPTRSRSARGRGCAPPGRGCNYVIGRATPELLNVAAIRSTGLTASLGIAEHVAEMIAPGVAEAPLEPVEIPPTREPWWRRAQLAVER